METGIEKLSQIEKNILYSAPAVVSVMASLNEDGTIDENSREDAIRLAHLRTFTAAPSLTGYYQEVETTFVHNFNHLSLLLPEDAEAKKDFLKREVVKLSVVLSRLNKGFVDNLMKSLKSYSSHVMRAKSTLLEYFFMSVLVREHERFTE